MCARVGSDSSVGLCQKAPNSIRRGAFADRIRHDNHGV